MILQNDTRIPEEVSLMELKNEIQLTKNATEDGGVNMFLAVF